jgi:hypothetical protein
VSNEFEESFARTVQYLREQAAGAPVQLKPTRVILPPECRCASCRDVYCPEGLEVVDLIDNGVVCDCPVVVCPNCGQRTRIIHGGARP